MPSPSKRPVLLSGGNPQIPKGDGDGPVADYLDAMPDWKGDVGRQVDALVVATVPDVRKAVRWNSPFYGVQGRGWFLTLHCFTRYVKVSFLNGSSLDPLPPVSAKDPGTYSVHVGEDTPLDEARFVDWVRQAAGQPGWDGF
jgi:hypothetical protein